MEGIFAPSYDPPFEADDYGIQVRCVVEDTRPNIVTLYDVESGAFVGWLNDNWAATVCFIDSEFSGRIEFEG